MMGIADPKPNDPYQWTQEPWGRALRCGALPAPHLFTSRDVVLRDDEREWAAVASSLGASRDRLRLIQQVHGIQVAVARRGATWLTPHADIVLTADRDVAIGVRTADCAPILLLDKATGAVGAVHAGWRGTASAATVAAVRAMKDAFGTRAADLVAAIGPCLGRCCGEVGPEVAEAFRAGGADPGAISCWFTPGTGDRLYLDLERANREQLELAGVHTDAIFAAGLCTKTHHDRLHSYRAERGSAGRLLAAIRCP